MTTERALRFVAHEACACRDRDSAEALCLLLPALMRVLDLDPMDDCEAQAVAWQLKQDLSTLNDHVHPSQI